MVKITTARLRGHNDTRIWYHYRWGYMKITKKGSISRKVSLMQSQHGFLRSPQRYRKNNLVFCQSGSKLAGFSKQSGTSRIERHGFFKLYEPPVEGTKQLVWKKMKWDDSDSALFTNTACPSIRLDRGNLGKVRDRPRSRDHIHKSI